ncbi:tetratricopeptide repeat protein [Altererythrobacter aquiaggeris]|uniref:tetratricopeptide repeat protein n=1 Tax=Aestuarierythrobacter aquiaggeris TaxID=1898396 RepID=UPI0030184729
MGDGFRTAGKRPAVEMSLYGPFSLIDADGVRIPVTSRRGQALLAMLATSGKGERARNWLQQMLWCDRAPEQARPSLRRELSNLRKQVNAGSWELLFADSDRVWLDLDLVKIDLRLPGPRSGQDFLEGLDIPGEEAFEDWLREQRMKLAAPPGDYLSDQRMAASASGREPFALRPAIAVLPLALHPGDGDNEFLIHGLAESLINSLSRLRWMSVIAKNSSFAVDSSLKDLREIGAALGARYIVEGQVQGNSGPYILTVTMTDAENGQILWTDNFAIDDLGNADTMQRILSAITASLGHQIDQNEQRRAMQKRAGDLDVAELVWRAKWHFGQLSSEGIEEAAQLLDQAAAIAPNSPDVLIEKAWLLIRQLWLERGSDADIRTARRAAQKAILADHEDARGHMLAGIAEFWLRQPLRAESLLRRAVDLDPSLVMAHAQLGSALLHKGAWSESIDSLETARTLSPNDFDLFYIEGDLAMAHLGARQLSEAVDHADAALSRRSAYWLAHVAKISALMGLDRPDEAADAYRELIAVQPHFKPEFIDWLPYLDVARNVALKDAVKQAASEPSGKMD